MFVKGMRERYKRGGQVGLAPTTIKNYMIAMKKVFFRWANEQKLIPSLPAFPKILAPKKKPQPIPAESFERLLAKAPDVHWRAFLLAGWWGGLRLSEVRELRWERCQDWPWIDFEGNRVILPAEFSKSGEDQSVPLHPKLRQVFAELPRAGNTGL
jgi:integrase